MDVHRSIGPGLVESAYAVCLAHELQIQGIAFVGSTMGFCSTSTPAGW
jgi:PD-(D/E)XK nuclease superfamily